MTLRHYDHWLQLGKLHETVMERTKRMPGILALKDHRLVEMNAPAQHMKL